MDFFLPLQVIAGGEGEAAAGEVNIVNSASVEKLRLDEAQGFEEALSSGQGTLRKELGEDVGESEVDEELGEAEREEGGAEEGQGGQSLSISQAQCHKVLISSGQQSTKKRRLFPIASMPPLQLELDEIIPGVAAEVTFGEVHKENLETRTWEGYPTGNEDQIQKQKFRGLRKGANYYVQEEDEKLLKYILLKGMERYVKSKNLWLAMEREKVVEYRSWQSMKERFLKSIMKKLGMFTWVRKEEKERLRMGAAVGRKRMQ